MQSYDVELDLTDGAGRPGRGHLPHDDGRPLRLRRAGRGDLHRPDRAGRRTRSCSTAQPLDVAAAFDGNRIALDRPGRRQRAAWSSPTAPTCAPARACTASSTRSTARSTSTRSSRPSTPTACTPASTSPTSRRRSASTVQAPARLGRSSATARSSERPADGEPGTWTLRRRRRGCRPTSPRWSPGRTHSVHDEHDGIPLGIYCRASLAAAPRPRRALHRHQAGLRLLPPGVRLPLPVRQVRPAVRAGVQRRRDGERRRASRSSRTTSSAPRSPTRRTSGAPRRSCTRWRTCGSATSSPCAGGTTCGSTSASRPTCRCCAQVEATRFTGGWTTFANTEKTWAYRQDQLPSTHPIAADILDIEAVKVNFDGITYAKGASVLKQLVAWVGQDAFLPALRDLLRARTRTATPRCADLLGALERASGRDLSDWSAEWLETAGRQHAAAGRSRPTRDGAFTSFAVAAGGAGRSGRRCARTASRSASTTSSTASWSAPRREELDVVGAKHRGAGAGRRAPARPRAAQRRRPDLRQDPPRRALAARRSSTHVGDFADSLPRALCWAAAWDMTRDAEMPARDYVATGARRHRRRDRHRRRAVAAAPGAVGARRCTPTRPGRRPAGRSWPTRRSTPLRAAEPGSDLQLAWARALGAVGPLRRAAGPAARPARRHAPRCPGSPSTPSCAGTCCSGSSPLGVAGDAEIDAELERDRDRRRRAARRDRPGRCGRPREAKAEAWRLAVEDESMPNAVQSAVIGGFAQPEQLELLRAVRRAVLRRRRPGLGDAHRRDRAERRRRALPGAARRPGRRRAHRRLPGRARRASRRCAGCCSRAATASSARCAPASGTPPPADAARGRRPRRVAARADGAASLRPARVALAARTAASGGCGAVGGVGAVAAAARRSAALRRRRRARLAPAGGVGDLADGVDDAAGQVAAAEGAGHRQHGEGADAVGHAAAHGRAGDDLDPALAGGDDDAARRWRCARRARRAAARAPARNCAEVVERRGRRRARRRRGRSRARAVSTAVLDALLLTRG